MPLGARVRKFVVKPKFQGTPRTMLPMVLTCSSVTLHVQYCRRQGFFRLDNLRKGRRNYHFQRIFDNKVILIKTTLASNLLCSVLLHLPVVSKWPVGWYRTFGTYNEKIGRRRANRSRPRAIDMNYAKTAEKASCSRQLVATTH